jgi:hypothetical protein
MMLHHDLVATARSIPRRKAPSLAIYLIMADVYVQLVN